MHLIRPTALKAFPKTFPTEMKRSKCPAKEKPRGEKSETDGREKAKGYSYEILLSVHVQTSEADIWLLEHKVLEGREVLDL